MATTLTVASVTPYWIKLIVSGEAEGSSTATLTAAQLLAACAMGPLKTYLGNLNARAASWALLQRARKIDVYVEPESSAADYDGAGFLGGPNRFVVTTTGPFTGVVEIRFLHSIDNTSAAD